MTEQTTTPFRLDDLLSSNAGWPEKMLARGVEFTSGLRKLDRYYQQLQYGNSAWEFVDAAFDALNINYQHRDGLSKIPKTGSTLIVANHPFGAVEGMIMIHMLVHYRKDVKVMANHYLQRIPELADHFIAVDPYGEKGSVQRNLQPLREAIRWLKDGGLLVVFPAGDVAQLDSSSLSIKEREWTPNVARMARRSKATVVPIYFEGRNSLPFLTLSKLHPRIQTLLLPRQLLNKRNHQFELAIGDQVPPEKLSTCNTDDEILRILRLKCEMLADTKRNKKNSPALFPIDAEQHTGELAASEPLAKIVSAVSKELLSAEISALPQHTRLSELSGMEVYCCDFEQIPWVMKEIGRLRELTFRSAGEGTGKPLDIDSYDATYKHLFIWQRENQEVVGAYRLGLVDELTSEHGRAGLYSYSLFKYSRKFIDSLPPTIELGRSFICQEYQKSFAPLLLLWKGIGNFVAANPRYTVLFGPVSISNEYTSLSHQLLTDFLKANRFDSTLGKRVKPRNPIRKNQWKKFYQQASTDGFSSFDELSDLISFIEQDGKGAPILLKQYMKMGGRFLGFNRDAEFNDCLDGLIMVDLKETDYRMLKKYMGQEKADKFLQYNLPEPLKTA